MSSSFLEDKINDLQARLKAETENETPERTNTPKDLGISALASPRQGSGRRPKQRKLISTIFSISCHWTAQTKYLISYF